MNSNINILRKRNLETYKEVQKTYQNSNKALVVQATGTGKSFLAIQLLLDNLDKKPLFLCPLNGIISQLEEHIDNLKDENGNYIMVRRTEEEKNNSDKTGTYQWEVASTNQKLTFDMHTYAWLNNKSATEIEEMDYDLVITDEAHRIGAPEWKKNMEHFLQTHQDSQLFGITATPVRERGKSNQFDISDESFIFGGNIIQGETLEEALLNRDLPMPTYINTSVQLLGRLEEIQDKVEKRMSDSEEKKEYLNKIKQARKKFDLNESIPQLLAKHLKYNGKYIVFCNAGITDDENIKDIVKKIELANSWFRELTSQENIEIYKCTYDSPKASQSAENFAHNLDKDGNDVSNKLRLMYAVNKYNEGIHVDDIDGVIMTRHTDSEIIYYQQLGRCLAVGKKNKPVVVDLAGNFEFAKQLKNKIKQERKRQEGNINSKENNGVGLNTNNNDQLVNEDDFILIDEYIETEEFIEILKYKLNLTEHQKKEEYIEKMAKLNNIIINGSNYQFSNGKNMGNWFSNLTQEIKMIEKKEEQGKKLTEEEEEKLEIYFDIKTERKKYNFELARKEEYIAKMHEIKNIIKQNTNYNFSDGSNMGNWFSNLTQVIKRIEEKKEQGKKLTEEEEEKLEIYFDIKTERKKYNFELARKEEYIAKMYEIKDIITSRAVYNFSDGSNMGNWFSNLTQAIKRIDKKEKQGKKLTEEEEEKLKIYLEIQGERKKYNFESARKEEYIAKIDEIKNIIKQAEDYKFSDETKMGTWYNRLKQNIKKIQVKQNQGKKLNEEDLEKLEIHQEIEEAIWNLGYKASCEYVYMYKDLHPIKYKTASKYELSKWLDEQRSNYQLPNKDEIQLQHEQKLFELYPGWLYKTKDQYANSIVNQLSVQTSETIDDIQIL